MEKDVTKNKSKLLVITGDFFLSDSQISKEDKAWLYPQMIQAIKKVSNSIILVFSPARLSNLMNYGYETKGWIANLIKNTVKYGEPEKTTGPSGVIPIAVLKEESNVEIPLLVFSFYYWDLSFHCFLEVLG